ncbi:Vacuolar protein sorting-associated protein [Apiospora arundinis]
MFDIHLGRLIGDCVRSDLWIVWKYDGSIIQSRYPDCSIAKFLSLRNKVRLSAANEDYRALFAPEIFATVTFTNDDRVAQSAVGSRKGLRENTTRIEFGPELIAQISDEDRISPEDKLTSPVLLPAAAELLQGRHTPDLQAAQIHFDFEFDVDAWDDDGEGFSIYTFEEPEDEGRTRDKEEYWEWRALMKETWQALSSNPHVKDLTIKEFVPRWTSAFRTDDFRSFLGRLESANLSILGMDNGAAGKPTRSNATSFSSPKTWTRSSSIACTTSGIWRSTRPRKGRSDARVSATSRWR